MFIAIIICALQEISTRLGFCVSSVQIDFGGLKGYKVPFNLFDYTRP